jgi:hypothetical protein
MKRHALAVPMNELWSGLVPTDKDHALALVDDLLTQALRSATAPASPHRTTTTPMTASLAEACRLARVCGVPPERLIVMLKAVWQRLRDVPFATRDDAQAALDRVVSACIRDYFADQSSAGERSSSMRQ